MNRSDLIGKLAVEKNIPFSIAEAIVAEMFRSMTDTLVAGDRIEIRGFGSFAIREYEGYSGRNPKTGLMVTVAPKRNPFFKVGKDLKDLIMGS